MAKKKYNVIREEMLQVASNVAEEKNIDQDSVFSAMEQALEKAARVKYGQEIDIRISIDRETGDINLNSYLEVVQYKSSIVLIVYRNSLGGVKVLVFRAESGRESQNDRKIRFLSILGIYIDFKRF